MKKSILTSLLGLGLVSGAFAAGSYVENFETVSSLSYVGNKSTSLANGAEVWANNGTAVNLYSNGSPSWKGLRIAQDTTQGTVATYVIGSVENSSTRANSFTASFDLLFKNGTGAPADRFSFNFGNLINSGGSLFPRDGESGLWVGGQSGSMLSLVWDFYDNGSGDYIGTGGNGGVQLFKNGALVSGSNANSPVTIASNLSGSFTRINLRYDEELNGGTFTFNTGGAVGGSNLISGGSDVFTLSNLGVQFAAGDKFAFSASTGASDMDMFIDNVSIQSVPEPSSASLLIAGTIGLLTLGRRRKKTD